MNTTLGAHDTQQKFLINIGSKTINFRVTKFFVSKILSLQYMLNMTLSLQKYIYVEKSRHLSYLLVLDFMKVNLISLGNKAAGLLYTKHLITPKLTVFDPWLLKAFCLLWWILHVSKVSILSFSSILNFFVHLVYDRAKFWINISKTECMWGHKCYI